MPIRYTVYSTSNCDYQSWQCELLDRSFERCGQPGDLVRLCSEEPGDLDRPMENSRVARVLCLPSWAENEKTGDLWPIANKPASLELWLESLPAALEDEAVLFLDPDMLFFEAVDLDPQPGQVIGQRWVDAGVAGHSFWDRYAGDARGRITGDRITMYPFCATVGDMRRIAGRFREISHRIRDENPSCWEADMFGLVIAMHEAELRVDTRDDLGVCNNWEQRFGPLPPIVHYPAKMRDAQGETLWFKQNYTASTRSFPWKRPPLPSRACNPLERRLLEAIHEHIHWQARQLR